MSEARLEEYIRSLYLLDRRTLVDLIIMLQEQVTQLSNHIEELEND